MSALVRLRGLQKHYGAKRALGPIDLVLERSEIVGVVGPDGAGKTTLLRSIAGLLEIEAAEASVLGTDLTGDVTELKRHIGYVPQSFSLHRNLSVIENLRFTARLHRLPSDEFERRAQRLLGRTGLAPFTDRMAGALSGGMKQKLAIANALLVAPRLIVLDEPTAGVDVAARSEIWQMLESEKARALVLISTSYLDEAAACDRLVYLDGGRVLAIGAPAELRARTTLGLFRVWGEDSKRTSRAARALPYVRASRACAGYARVEVSAAGAPSEEDVLRELARLAGARFAERTPVDMESALLALARRTEPA
jgi:ABC-2 type transport system ATP-binding protein